jgi:hypothetical protein
VAAMEMLAGIAAMKQADQCELWHRPAGKLALQSPD